MNVKQDNIFHLNLYDYSFQFQTVQDTKQWILSINYFITTSKPYCKNVPAPNFFLQHQLPLEEFVKRAESLDVLLFKNKSIACKL